MNEIIATDKEQDPPPSRLIVTLAVAGLISGLAIVGVFEATFETITRQKAEELRAAVFEVLPGVTRMQKLVFRKGGLAPVTTESDSERAIYGGYDAALNFVGYAIPAEGPGFQDTIKLLYGYSPSTRKVLGMEVLESRETPGLGDKIYKDADFVASFTDLAIDPVIEVVKKGRGGGNNQVDAITGATISSRAVVRIINQANQDWLDNLPAPGSEPEMSTEAIESGHDGN